MIYYTVGQFFLCVRLETNRLQQNRETMTSLTLEDRKGDTFYIGIHLQHCVVKIRDYSRHDLVVNDGKVNLKGAAAIQFADSIVTLSEILCTLVRDALSYAASEEAKQVGQWLDGCVCELVRHACNVADEFAKYYMMLGTNPGSESLVFRSSSFGLLRDFVHFAEYTLEANADKPDKALIKIKSVYVTCKTLFRVVTFPLRQCEV